MGNLEVATIFMLLVNVTMWFATMGALAVNPTGSICYHVENSFIGDRITNESMNNNVLDDLPQSQDTQISGGTSGGFVTDLFNSILGFFKGIPAGLNYITGVIAAPYNILKCTGLPNEAVMGIGIFWYLSSLLVFLSYLFWR